MRKLEEIAQVSFFLNCFISPSIVYAHKDTFLVALNAFQAEEKKLELAEQYLEEDAQMFDEFLKENDKNSVDAIKMYVNHQSHQVLPGQTKEVIL